jgi:hypothetical protein
VIAVIQCEQCGEQSDVVVVGSMGATDLLPDSCEYCETPWPMTALNDPGTEVYA